MWLRPKCPICSQPCSRADTASDRMCRNLRHKAIQIGKLAVVSYKYPEPGVTKVNGIGFMEKVFLKSVVLGRLEAAWIRSRRRRAR
jgi:hypothetical protein